MHQLGEPSPHRCWFSWEKPSQMEKAGLYLLVAQTQIQQQDTPVSLPCFASAFETGGKG